MLGIIFTIVDGPMVIQNSGVFVLGVALTCISVAFVMACCMIAIRDGVEVIVEDECYNQLYGISVQSRFDEIVGRVQASLLSSGQVELGLSI